MRSVSKVIWGKVQITSVTWKACLGAAIGGLALFSLICGAIFLAFKTDDAMRKVELSEHIVAEANSFVATLTKAHGTLYRLTAQATNTSSLTNGAQVDIVGLTATIQETLGALQTQHANLVGEVENGIIFAQLNDIRPGIVDYTEKSLKVADLASFGSAKAMRDIQRVDELYDALLTASYQIQNSLSAENDAVRDETARWLRSGWVIFIAASLAGLLLSAGFAWSIGRKLAARIKSVSAAIGDIAGGRQVNKERMYAGQDELGEIVRNLTIFERHAMEAKQLTAVQARQKQETEQRIAQVGKLSEQFDIVVSDVLQQLSQSGAYLSQTSTRLAQSADNTKRRTGEVTQIAESANQMVNNATDICRELTSSVQTIGQGAKQSIDGTGKAEGAAAQMGTILSALDASATKIGDVLNLISEISDRTNLLALNATIEAARAGEAGRGFAIVASEVKNLAGQTAEATADIAQLVAEIQNGSAGAVSAIGNIREIARENGDFAQQISEQVEHQMATVQAVAQSIGQLGEGNQAISQALQHVLAEADETDGSALQLAQAVDALLEQSSVVRSELDAFFVQLKAA